MSMEQNEPQSNQGQQGPPPAAIHTPQEGAPLPSQGAPATSNPGQNQGQRRRRRRRKTGKGTPPAASAQSVASSPASPSDAFPSQAESPMPATLVREGGNPEAGPHLRQARNHSQGHHKKQKPQNKGGAGNHANNQPRQFQKQSNAPRDFNREPREYNPGNGNGGARRKNKVRRGTPTFVGPMDHSYRAVNGNVADGPPSTMDFRHSMNGNGNGNIYRGNGYSEAPETLAPAILRHDAPTRILCFIEDLFVVARTQEHAKKLGVKVSFPKADKDTVATITELPESERPSLIVFDLNNANAKPLTLIPKLKAKLKRGTSIIGFLSHIQGDLKLKAVEAGCDTVMPKAAFSQNLPNLLRRHGLEEEIEEPLEV